MCNFFCAQICFFDKATKFRKIVGTFCSKRYPILGFLFISRIVPPQIRLVVLYWNDDISLIESIWTLKHPSSHHFDGLSESEIIISATPVARTEKIALEIFGSNTKAKIRWGLRNIQWIEMINSSFTLQWNTLAIKTISIHFKCFKFRQFEIKPGPTTLNSLVQFKIKMKHTTQVKANKKFMVWMI